MYCKKYTKTHVRYLPKVLISHLLNASHAKLCAVESEMNKKMKTRHKGKKSRQNILTVVELRAQIKTSSIVSYTAFFSPKCHTEKQDL